jgi:CheY-like chemotaxis protein/anti-sigma regulatory factor (Ser/Thr protein kinase)
MIQDDQEHKAAKTDEQLLKVLIVDDHQYNRDLLAFILEDHGYTQVQAGDGEQAVEMLQTDKDIGVVLMDVNMPVMDGREATRIIKNTVKDRFIPIVFVTALDDDETLSQCLQAGGDDFVPKPVNENVLLAKLAAHRRTAGLYRQLQEINQTLSYHQRLMEREHAIVDHVFKKGMTRVDSECENVNFHISPMSMFNGDVLLVAPSPSGGLYVLLGDFTGHGLSAAIGSLPVSDIFYAMTAKQTSVAELAAEINHKLQDLLPSNMFFCAAILEFSSGGDRLSYWVGGMNDLLLVAADGGVVRRLEAQHMPLGVLTEDEFESNTETVTPPPGTRLFAYTDGVIESQNEKGELFGEERLEEVLTAPCDSMVEAVSRAVYDYRKGGEQTDDMSMVEVLCAPIVHTQTIPLSANTTALSMPWELKFRLGATELRRDDVVASLISQLGGVAAIKPHLDILFTLISELFSNALEHGLLGLDSSLKSDPDGFQQYYQSRKRRLEQLSEGSIDITLRVIGAALNKLEIVVSDSGEGFDVSSTEKGLAHIDDSFGRGISLIGSLAESVEYSNGGSTVTARYRLD